MIRLPSRGGMVPEDIQAMNPILVTGTARSGTSLITGVIAKLGAWAGITVPGGPDNPMGFFENILIREAVMKGHLASLGADILGQDAIPEPVDVDTAVGPMIRYGVNTIARSQGYGGGPWVYKDARLAQVYPAWHNAFPMATWILVRRSREGILASCGDTQFMNARGIDDWEKWVDTYLLGIARLADDPAIKTIDVSFDKFIAGENQEFSDAMHKCGIGWDTDVARSMIIKDTGKA